MTAPPRLAAVPGLRLDPKVVETNIVLVDVAATGLPPEELLLLLERAGVRAMERDASRVRFVTHRLIGDDDVEEAARVVAEVVERHSVPPFELPEVEGLAELEEGEPEEAEHDERGAG